jgi:hypothetical protein
MMLLTGLTSVAAEKTTSGSFVTVRAEAQELARIGEEDFRGTSTNNRPVSYKIKAKKGWKLQSPKNGKLDLAMGELSSYAVTSLMGEDGGTGTVHTCEFLNVVTNHISAPTVAAYLLADGAYLVGTNGAMNASLSINGGSLVTKKGEHEEIRKLLPCPICGKQPYSTEVTISPFFSDPDIYGWCWSVQRNGGGFTSSGAASGQSFSESLMLTSAGTYQVAAVLTGRVSWCTQCVCSATATTNCILTSIPKILTCTVVTEPQNRDRKILGLGEEVTLTLVPAMENVTWSLNGPGKKEGEGSSVKFIAPDIPCESTTVTAAYTGGSVSVPFKTIKPGGVYFENMCAFGSGSAPPKTQYFSLSVDARVYISPDSVNFHKIKVFEGAASPECHGYFEQNPIPSHAENNPKSMTSHVVTGKGTEEMIPEGDGLNGSVDKEPFTDGYANWNIPWRYTINGVTDDICIVVQRYSLSVDGTNVTFKVTKGGAGAKISTGDLVPSAP